MSMLYVAALSSSLGALAGVVFTLWRVKPKRCPECTHRHWVETLKAEFEGR